jgi:hypothetical protein
MPKSHLNTWQILACPLSRSEGEIDAQQRQEYPNQRHSEPRDEQLFDMMVVARYMGNGQSTV